VFFDNLKVPSDNLIGEECKGFRYILDGMNAERILDAQKCIGDGRWLLKKGIDYAQGAGRLRPADRAEPGRAVPAGARVCRA
jgi:alkylation response protein AidB-like acyl-CoA dehydrogenase